MQGVRRVPDDLRPLAAKALDHVISDEAGPASNRVGPKDRMQWRADVNRLRPQNLSQDLLMLAAEAA